MRHLLLLPAFLFGTHAADMTALISPGAQIDLRTSATIHVVKWDGGCIYPAHVAQDVYSKDGGVVIPAGAYAELIVRRVGHDRLAVDLESVTVNGERYVLDPGSPQFDAHRYDNGSGLIGKIVGAVTGDQTQGREIHIPAASVLMFQLQEPLHAAGRSDPGYMHDSNHYHHENDWYR